MALVQDRIPTCSSDSAGNRDNFNAGGRVVKIHRSSKCSLRFSTDKKQEQLRVALQEYGRVVNLFIDQFWFAGCPDKSKLLKPIVDSVETWLSARLRKVAAREAIDMVLAVRNRKRDRKSKTTPKKPRHAGKRMAVSSTIAELQSSKTNEFDAWLHIQSIGHKVIFDIPIRFHRHYNGLQSVGKRLNSYVITDKYVQFVFEIEVEKKLPLDKGVGIDTGINALASVSTGDQFGTDIKSCIERIKRCKHGSKGQKTARRALRQRIDEVAKQVISIPCLSFVVVENLTGITKNTKLKGRLSRNIRSSIGNWNVRYWLGRLEQNCERDRVSFRSISPYKTSQECSCCGHTDRMNRLGEKFKCLACGYEDNADVQASRTILHRFITGKYGSGCKGILES